MATPADQLDGAVTDQTITVAGQEFYKNFCAFWHDQPLNEMFALAVRELERTGAFERSVLLVATTTGRGDLREGVG